jgi:hypothetical protein
VTSVDMLAVEPKALDTLLSELDRRNVSVMTAL